VENDFAALSGYRVGLIVNHTAQVDTIHLIDRIAEAPSVELEALFAPEHGLRGTTGAGQVVEDGRDPKTGTKIYSLYGETRQPTSEMLKGLDALVFDVQDVGARFYTFITTMGLAMQAAAEADVRFVVLDRPNPLGGTYVSGFVLEPDHQSFVGRYPIPVAHGLTVGELARYIKGESLLTGLDDLTLSVVSMDGWTRNMQWPDTQQNWRAPSPNLPTWQTALLYPGMAFFEGVDVNEGRGTDQPFQQIGFPWSQDAVLTLVERVRRRPLPGLTVDTTTLTPRSRPGAPSPRYEGERLPGLQLRIVDRTQVRPVETGLRILQAAVHQAYLEGDSAFISRPDHLTRLAGTDHLTSLLETRMSPDSIVQSWQQEVMQFRQARRKYLLY